MLNRASNNSVLRIQGTFQQKLYMMGTGLDPRPAHIALLIFCLLEEIRFEERKTSFPATLECRGILRNFWLYGSISTQFRGLPNIS